MPITDERVLRLEILEQKFTLIKILIGVLVGTLFGLLKLSNMLYIFIGIGILFGYIFLAREIVEDLKNIRLAKLILWDGSFSYVIAMLMFWTIVYNLVNPITLT